MSGTGRRGSGRWGGGWAGEVLGGKRLSADLYGSVESVEAKLPLMFGKLKPQDIVIVDESSTLDTFSTQRLLKAAGKARVAFLGDPGQLGAIGAAGCITTPPRAKMSTSCTQCTATATRTTYGTGG